jgi:type IV secretion system protein VirD4
VTSNSSRNPAYSSRTQSGETGDSWGEQSHALMTPEEIALFFGRDDHLVRQLIIRPGCHPMVLQRAYYDKHELFRAHKQFMENL